MLKALRELARSGIWSAITFLFKTSSAYVLQIFFTGGEEREIPANIWFQSQVCVKIASSQLWQGYATSREYTARAG